MVRSRGSVNTLKFWVCLYSSRFIIHIERTETPPTNIRHTDWLYSQPVPSITRWSKRAGGGIGSMHQRTKS